MKRLVYVMVALSIAALAGCTTTQKGAGLGTLLGAGTGAIIGHQSGRTKEGALIGGAVGAAAGALTGSAMETKYCPKCGTGYTGGVQYCTKDGSPLKFKDDVQEESAPVPQEKAPHRQSSAPSYSEDTVTGYSIKEGVFCPKCGTVYTGDVRYCPKDGAGLEVKK